MKRILHIVDGMSVGGGIQSFIMNVYRNINREECQFDFLLHRHNKDSYEEEIMDMGGKIYFLPSRNEGVLQNKKMLNAFFCNHKEYDTVHFHESSLSYIEPLVAAKRNGVKKRIIHSHSSKVIGNRRQLHILLHKYHQLKIDRIATDYLACGEVAAQWMYGASKINKLVKIVENGIDIEKYSFNSQVREEIRKEFSLSDNFVMGHIGRFEEVKNHKFLISVLEEVINFKPDACLLLIGNGTLFSAIKEEVNNKKLSSNVIFAGTRTDIPKLLQAIDILVFPSLYEGYPVVTIEAQAAGVPIVMSDTITTEVMIKKNVKQKSLDETPLAWAKEILNDYDRKNNNDCLYDAGVGIDKAVKQLMEIYNR